MILKQQRKHLLQPNRWSCLPTALAMLANVSLNDIFEKITHDGSEIIFPDLDEPIKRRSFSIEEIHYITPFYGFVLVPYSPGILYIPTKKHSKEILFPAFEDKLNERDGLIFGTPVGRSLGHVVTWSAHEGLVYDPNGTKYPIAGNFVIETFYGAFQC